MKNQNHKNELLITCFMGLAVFTVRLFYLLYYAVSKKASN